MKEDNQIQIIIKHDADLKNIDPDSLTQAVKKSAERILENNTVIEGYQFSRFDARLEECVKPENTYISSY